MCIQCTGLALHELGDRFRCNHHSCQGCGRKAHAAGGLLFRCAECPNAFCEDCLPRESRVVNDNPRLGALGYLIPKSTVGGLLPTEMGAELTCGALTHLDTGRCMLRALL